MVVTDADRLPSHRNDRAIALPGRDARRGDTDLLRAALLRAAAAHGLFSLPDPSSGEICSIGGDLATNSGGLCCVRDGVTGDYVLGLDVPTWAEGCCGGRAP